LFFFNKKIDRTIEVRYLMNYDPRLNEIITESKYIEQLGYPLPDIARTLALQVKNVCVELSVI
jgi:hypothetical protein